MLRRDVAEFWNLTDHVRGVLAEALVAEALHIEGGDAKLQRPRYPSFDVESTRIGSRVDAKVATILDVDLDGTGAVTAVEWDGGAPPLIAEEATHLGLVVLDPDGTHLHLGAGSDSVLAGSVSVHGRVFLVPKVVVIQYARPIWATQKGQPSKGRFRYLRLDTVRKYEVEFTKRTGGGWTVKALEGTDAGPSEAADGDRVEFRHS
jgi:hypothetical protein